MTMTPDRDDAFERWLQRVDDEVLAAIGLSIHDLADQPFYDWWSDGITPKEARDLAFEYEGFDTF